MSNANRIHLLSLAAGTLNHIAGDYHNEDARRALKKVLAEIEGLTEAGADKAVKAEATQAEEQPLRVSPYANDEIRDKRENPPLSEATACGCGDPACALIDVLIGNRTDFTVESLLADFDTEFNPVEVATIVIDGTTRVQQGIDDESIKPTPTLAKNLMALTLEGKKRAEANGYKGNPDLPEVHVVESVSDLEKLLDGIFGKRETRH